MYSKREQIIKRAIEHGILFIKRNATIRSVARETKSNKSTVHKDLHRLKEFHPYLYEKVQEKLNLNIAVRHIRGGETTKRLYGKGEK